jgi:pimeloyl-ACP methyl ester carboxylesterase
VSLSREQASEQSMFVLIPGAWHGGWAWRPVARRLRAAGRQAVTLTMPGLADDDDRAGLRLQDAVDRVVTEVERRGLADITLVAHSWGGYPMTGAAHRLAGRLSKVIYCDAFVPAPGKSALDEFPPELAAGIRAAIRSTPDLTWVPTLEIIQQLLMQGEPEPVQRFLLELLVPQPGNYGEDVLDGPAVAALGVPAAYVLSEDDHGLPRPSADFAARLSVEPIMVPGTHEFLLTHPDELAQALLKA